MAFEVSYVELHYMDCSGHVPVENFDHSRIFCCALEEISKMVTVVSSNGADDWSCVRTGQ